MSEPDPITTPLPLPLAVIGDPWAEAPLGDTSGRFVPAPDPDDPAHFAPGTFVQWQGERFRVAERVGLMALMDYAEVAEQGVETDAIAGLTAMRRLLRDLIDERDWDRFHKWSIAARVDGDTFGQIIGQAMGVVGGRETPTVSPSGSPGGASTTGPSSSAISGGAGSPVDAWTQHKRDLGLTPVGEL